jgi:hypothetical protein
MCLGRTEAQLVRDPTLFADNKKIDLPQTTQPQQDVRSVKQAPKAKPKKKDAEAKLF